MPANEVGGRALGREARQAVIVAGVCSMVLGVVVLVWPQKTIGAAEFLLGLYLVLSAVLQVAVAGAGRFAPVLRILVVVGALLSAALAILCFAGGNSVLLLTVWIGLGWAVRGIIQATVAVWDDNLPDSGKQELFGLFTMAVGIIVVLLPLDSLTVLFVLVGCCLLAFGALELVSVGAFRKPFRPGAAVVLEHPLPDHSSRPGTSIV